MVGTFWLVTGYACNNRCPGCYAAKTKFKSSWLDLGYAGEIISEMKRVGAKTCLLIGGEPTLYPELERLVELGAEAELKVVIVSNGRKFSEAEFTKRMFGCGLDRAVISLEGDTSETHNSMTATNSFDETCEGIRNCGAIGRVNSLTTIAKSNCTKIYDTIKLAYSLGVSKAVLNCSIPALEVKDSAKNESLNPLELAKTIEKVFWDSVEANMPFQLNATFPLCILKKTTLEEGLKKGWLSVGCHMYRGLGVVFEPDGNILPCTHFAGSPLKEEMITADKKFRLSGKFDEFWIAEDNEPSKFRNDLWEYPALKCSKCEYWGGCVGGCPLFWNVFDPIDIIDKRKEDQT